jgi:cell division protein FtsB
VLLVLVVFLSVAVYKRYSVERLMAERRIEADRDKQELIERKKGLEERVEYLSGDRGIEEEIRTHFDVAKEGEQVIILVGEEKKEENTEIPAVEKKPWYKFWQ